MCVIIKKRAKRLKGPVVAWKIFRVYNKKLYSLVRDFRYKTGKLYTTKAPGFQAFVNRTDAEYSRSLVWKRGIVRMVLIYGAAEGVIQSMERVSNGKPGWTARKICIPKKGR